MLIGYARVSTADQNLDLQKDALLAAGCERIYTDTASGARAERPGLSEALKMCRPGDTLVVWKLDRLGRSLPHLVETVRDLAARKVGFQSLQEKIDTTTSGGKLVFHIFASLAEFERDLIRERTNAGLSAARARGRMGGRPKGVDERKRKAALALQKDTTRSVKENCEILGVSRNTYYKYIRLEDRQTSRQEDRPAGKKPSGPAPKAEPPAPQAKNVGSKSMRIQLWLRVENNSKFVHGKGKAREEIERDILSRYGMEKTDPGGGEYVLSIPYATDEELDRIINEEVWAEAASIADLRHCFIEGDIVSQEDPDRRW